MENRAMAMSPVQLHSAAVDVYFNLCNTDFGATQLSSRVGSPVACCFHSGPIDLYLPEGAKIAVGISVKSC